MKPHSNASTLVLGARGLVGSALVTHLQNRGQHVLTPTHDELDLSDPVRTRWYFSVYRPSHVYFAAAKVGGIADNAKNKIGFLADNLHIELNVLQTAAQYDVQKLLFIGTSCMYPRDCAQPMKEEYLGTGPLESTTEAYSVAKLAGMKLCQYYREEEGRNFVTALPCNVYGPRDNFHPFSAHCLPGMMGRMAAAKDKNADIFLVWGDGTARREFIYSEDLAAHLALVMEKYDDPTPINVGSGEERTMRELAELLRTGIGFDGDLMFDTSKPTGAPRKLMDNSKLQALGAVSVVGLNEGLHRTYQWYRDNHSRSLLTPSVRRLTS